MAAVFGLLAATLWGISDLFSRASARKLGPWCSIFYGQFPGLILFDVWMAASPAAREKALSGATIYWILAQTGSVGTSATAYFLSRALIEGAITLVAAIAASYGAVATLLAIGTGERLSAVASLGVMLSITGVLASAFSQKAQQNDNPNKRSWAGIGWATGSAFCYGTTLWLQGHYVLPHLGASAVLWLTSWVSIALTTTIVKIQRVDLKIICAKTIIVALSYKTLSGAAYCVLAICLS